MELQNESRKWRLTVMAKELQVYVSTENGRENRQIWAESFYRPSVYKAKLSVKLDEALEEEDAEHLEQKLLRVLEERLKHDFKRMMEDTEENDGFLEAGALAKLSDKLSRYVERTIKPYKIAVWETGID